MIPYLIGCYYHQEKQVEYKLSLGNEEAEGLQWEDDNKPQFSANALKQSVIRSVIRSYNSSGITERKY